MMRGANKQHCGVGKTERLADDF